ncbi:MAG TPA: nitroreductase/quinone reductase family protein [Ktedonosporobacter sp.]|nr:nitroreductase/quinone reductase family protein [Ktedonosporobacter sp.]
MQQKTFRLSIFSLILYNLTGGRVHIGNLEDPVGILVLTTTGRKSGKVRSVHLVYIRDGSSYVVAASNAGKDKHPGWFFNLRSNEQVTLRIKNQQMKAVAEVASPEQRGWLWKRLVEAAPFFAGYQKSTRREIPMVLLHPLNEQEE